MSPILQILLVLALVGGIGAVAWFLALRLARQRAEHEAIERGYQRAKETGAAVEAETVAVVERHAVEQIAAIERAQTADLNADLAALRARRVNP